MLKRFIGLMINLMLFANLFSQGIPYGEEFQVNTYSNYRQSYPRIAVLQNGNYVISWINHQDLDIFGKLYGNNGIPKRNEFRINSQTSQIQSFFGTVAALSDSGFIGSWCAYDYERTEYGLFGRLFDSSGNPRGTEFQVNTNTSSRQYFGCPTIAVLSNGDFVMCWRASYDQSNYIDDLTDIYCQLFESSGNKKGNEVQVNTFTNGTQDYPNIAVLLNGSFVICWRDRYHGNISAQLFDIDGNKFGDELQVNTYVSSYKNPSSVAALSNGGFVVCWGSPGQSRPGSIIVGQLFDSTGNKKGNEFQINTSNKYYPYYPLVKSLDNDNFIVIWSSYRMVSFEETTIFGQLFDNNGEKVESEFRINTYIGNYLEIPSLAALSNGEFLVCWCSQHLSSGDIFGKYFPGEPLIHQLTEYSLIEPMNDATINVTYPTFHWHKPICTQECYPWEITFDLYVDTDYNFSTPQIIKDIQDTTYTIDSLERGQTYFWKVLAKNLAGDSLWSIQQDWGFFISHNASSVEIADENVPQQFELFQNYPNPFNSGTDIKYSLSLDNSSHHITLKIYDIRGRLVNSLVDQNQAAGRYSVNWDGKDRNGNSVSSGVYFYTLQDGNYKVTKKLLLLE